MAGSHLLHKPSPKAIEKAIFILFEVDYFNLLVRQREHYVFWKELRPFMPPFQGYYFWGAFTQGVALGCNISPLQGLSEAPRGRPYRSPGQRPGDDSKTRIALP
jgi:hypothetical protein